MKNYLVSVIMPAYNVEKYIAQSIQSVINQTYNNWELIIVNDGSTDNTLAICKDYAKKESRIKVITQKNQHQGPARNKGFTNCSGDFIYFSDSDDIIHPQCFEILINLYKEENYDFLYFGLKCFSENENLSIQKIANLPEPVYIPVHRAVWSFAQTPPTSFFTRKLLEKSGVNFPSYFHEDDAEMYRIYSSAKKIAKIDETLYFYRRRSGSTMGIICNPHTVDTLKVVERFIQIANERPAFKDIFYAKAEFLIELRINDWKNVNEEWAKNAVVQGENFLESIKEYNKDNPYVFVSKDIKNVYENSLSWKVTKPLRTLKRILRKY